jgi:hypothetical protein
MLVNVGCYVGVSVFGRRRRDEAPPRSVAVDDLSRQDINSIFTGQYGTWDPNRYTCVHTGVTS